MNIDIERLAFLIRESLKNINTGNKKIDININNGRYYLVVWEGNFIDTPTHISGMPVIVTHSFIQDDYILCCSDPTKEDLVFLREFEDVRNLY